VWFFGYKLIELGHSSFDKGKAIALAGKRVYQTPNRMLSVKMFTGFLISKTYEMKPLA
jgi:hypothetical protein